jgi:hypothetical protein
MKALSKLKAEEGIWMNDVPQPDVEADRQKPLLPLDSIRARQGSAFRAVGGPVHVQGFG